MENKLQEFAVQLDPALARLDSKLSEKEIEQANVAALKAFYHAVAEGNFAEAQNYLADDIEFELYGLEPLPYVMKAQGLKDVMVGIEQNFGNTEWTAADIETLVAQGDQVVLIGREAGRHRATGNAFERRAVLEYQLQNQKIIRYRAWVLPLPATTVQSP
jgi:ketosteroid isomerase-like protein